MFLDEIVITIKSGRGGRGCESYIRRADRKMIPNGGDGGSGGDVMIRSDGKTGSLFALKSKRIFEAEAGGFGMGKNRYGQTGRALVLNVPCGTNVYNRSDHLLLRDLVKPDDQVVAAKGGRGGYGNHAGRPATAGEEGVSLELLLSFSIIADIFLVGLPNSGKTALLKALTGAHLESTDYPFATKAPRLGTYESTSGRFQICELPSVYEHSAEGRGLGNSFLKHLKRAKLIAMVLDPLNSFAPTLKEGYDILMKAVTEFDAHYARIPRLVVINKMDIKEAKKKIRAKRIRFKDPHVAVSALTKEGLVSFVRHARILIKNSETL